jgi:hypothetical protein
MVIQNTINMLQEIILKATSQYKKCIINQQNKHEAYCHLVIKLHHVHNETEELGIEFKFL